MSVHEFPQKINAQTTVHDVVFDAVATEKLSRLDRAIESVERLEKLFTTALDKIENLTGPEKLSYSEKEAAEMLEMKVSTLQTKRRDGEIGACCIAGRWRYSSDDLRLFMKRNQIKPRR